MFGQTTLKAVTVDRAKLLDTIKSNRTRHGLAAVKAREEYREALKLALEAKLAALAAGKTPKPMIKLQPPDDHMKDYDRAVRMLEMSVDPVIDIDGEAFARLVDDDWEWKQSWLFKNSSYSSTIAAFASGGATDEDDAEAGEETEFMAGSNSL